MTAAAAILITAAAAVGEAGAYAAAAGCRHGQLEQNIGGLQITVQHLVLLGESAAARQMQV
jgi:hypothetical protein